MQIYIFGKAIKSMTYDEYLKLIVTLCEAHSDRPAVFISDHLLRVECAGNSLEKYAVDMK